MLKHLNRARSQKTIEAYSEALAGGAQFPPIIIQPVVNYPAPNTRLSDILLIILDGIHRWSAYKASGLTEIKAVLWQDQPLDYGDCKDEMLLESTRSNIHHGDRLSQTRVSEIVGNANFCIIDTLISQGREMPYIAGHLNMDLATAWAVKLTGLMTRKNSRNISIKKQSP